MKTTIQKIDEIVEAQHKEILRKVLEPYFDKPKEDIMRKQFNENLKEAISELVREPYKEPTYFFNYEQYKAFNEAMEAEIKPYIKIKDPSLPRGNNFTPKKKKRKMSELEHFFTAVSDALKKHHATMIVNFQTPIHEIG